ncbi:MAG: ABC transporter permease [Terriglobia bacterium]
MHTLLQDLRFGLRMLVKNPGFTAVAVITLALGIGATTAVFSVADRILFRSLPYPASERLVSVGFVAPIEPNEFMLGTDYLEWRAHQAPFESFTSMQPGVADCDLTDQNPVRLSCARVEASFLTTFGVSPLLGRNFIRDEDRPNAPKVALLAHGLWRSRFGGDPRVVGKAISLDGQPVRIVGVLASDFEFPTLAHVDILLPLALDETRQQRPNSGQVLRSFARLKPGVTAPQAQAALAPLFEESLKWVPAQFRKEVSVSVRSLRDRQVGDYRRASWILLAAVLAVLLIACANVAGLLLARGISREREIAVRSALGASRRRLVRQALTESGLLGLVGGGTGCIISYLFLSSFVRLAPAGIPKLDQASLDGRALLFALAASILSSLAFGLAPSLAKPRAEALASRPAAGIARHTFRQALVALQVALSLVLLAGASLLLRTLWNLQYQPLGLEAQGVITANINLGVQHYPQPAQQMAFYNELEARLQPLPGVAACALSDSLPPGGAMRSAVFAGMRVEGRPRIAEGTGGMVGWRAVTPGYFSALRIPILNGRPFEEADRNPDQHAIILSEALARRLFPGEDPLGKRLQRFPEQPTWFTVVGVAADVKNNGLTMPGDPEYYVVRGHAPEDTTRRTSLIIRSSLDPKAVAAWLRQEIVAIDPTLPVTIETMTERVGNLAARPRFNAALLTLFAGFGLLLAAVGIYGVIAFLVSQRTQEIGIRMALGAQRPDILRLVFRQGMGIILAGVALGLVGALGLTRFLASQLYNVRPTDPLTLGIASLSLAAITGLACFFPARRATKVDPIVALRYE